MKALLIGLALCAFGANVFANDEPKKPEGAPATEGAMTAPGAATGSEAAAPAEHPTKGKKKAGKKHKE